MPLRDTRALRDWAISSQPTDETWQRVHLWIVAAGSQSYRAPSVPDESRSDRPNYEVRTVRIPDTEVVVEYRHIYNGDFIDILSVG
ncbi:MAG: hypothetical protein ACYCUF_12665 [Acidimicrobiales bacterium]|nr:hypothetical protein [Actinomycetota bacterium]MDA8357344.1 hypothetical protein [Actinomycetota bacterium]